MEAKDLADYYFWLQEREEPMELLVKRKAQSKERPRLGRRGVVFTPERTRQFERLIAEVATTLNRTPYTCPVKFTMQVIEPIPKSYKGEKWVAAKYNLISPPVGDLDNKVKAVTDGLNGIAYVDDKQINDIRATRGYGDTYEIAVMIRRNGLSAREIELYERYGYDALVNESGA